MNPLMFFTSFVSVAADSFSFDLRTDLLLPESLPTKEVAPVIVILTVAAGLLSWRVHEAHHNVKKNKHGIAQWSSQFYRVQPWGWQWWNALPYTFNFVPTAIQITGMLYGGLLGSWITFFAAYVAVPLADLIVGEDSYNPTDEEEKQLKTNIWFRVLLWAYPPTYIASVLLSAFHINAHPELTVGEIAGIAVSVGIAGGFGIGCIHEMIHRPSKFDLALARIALIFSNYGHFWIEHLWGHHKRVATDDDPASSALGDNVYTFIPRCWYRGFWSAWEIEKRFCRKYGRHELGIGNRFIAAWTASAIVATTVYTFLGLQAFAFYLAQGVVVAIHIDNANFIEHYGLRRNIIEGEKDADGERVYEPHGWFHSWNTADRISNWILFKIERHPDHHTNAGRPYQILRHFSESPEMPTGYAGMFVLSWIPPLWWYIMDPLVEKAYKDRAAMEAAGKNYFPKGINQISTAYKREGEGYYEPGSSPYADGTDGGSDANKPSDVWKTDFTSLKAKVEKIGANKIGKKTK